MLPNARQAEVAASQSFLPPIAPQSPEGDGKGHVSVWPIIQAQLVAGTVF